MKRGSFDGYVSVRTAQGILRSAAAQPEGATGACGSACGAGDADTKTEEPKSACGSACGAGDK